MNCNFKFHKIEKSKLKRIKLNEKRYFSAVVCFFSVPCSKQMPYDVEHEITLVQWYVAKVGQKQADGSYICTFGDIFYDEEAEQIFESLV